MKSDQLYQSDATLVDCIIILLQVGPNWTCVIMWTLELCQYPTLVSYFSLFEFVTTHLKKKFRIPPMGYDFQFGYRMVTLINTDLYGIFSSTCWYLVILTDGKLSMFDTDLWNTPQSENMCTTHACSQPYLITMITAKGLFIPIENCTVSRQFSEGYSIAVCILKYLHVIIFFCNCVMFINRCHTWTIYDLCRKMIYQRCI